ncbi:MAG: DUF1338 domain-containing protein [Bacteroidetes bacterium]|nr:DUF1338 domain-containing protein [Bacteroidota bacterium]
MTHQEIFERLWQDYITQNPATKKVYDLLVREGETIVNDHVAFRTFNHPLTGIDAIAKIFLKNGYVYKGDYHFEQKKLYARHYEHKSDPQAPRVFISELLVEHFSEHMKATVNQWVASIPLNLIKSDELIFAGNVIGIPSYKTYEKLRIESEYAAWLYVNGFCANHFTVSVNSLREYDTVEKVNTFLKANGFLLNDANGEIQGTANDMLEQSSIKAGINRITFQEGEFDIPGCYYEFALRYPEPNGKLYSGFVAKSADKIFESTNYYKK